MKTPRQNRTTIKRSFNAQNRRRSLLLTFWYRGVHCGRHATCQRRTQNALQIWCYWVLLYREAGRNLYQQRWHPIRRTLIYLECRLRRRGHTQPNTTKAEKPRSHRSANVEDFLRAAERSSGTNTRRSNCRHHISQWTVGKVLLDLLLCLSTACSRCATAAGLRALNNVLGMATAGGAESPTVLSRALLIT
jgi:hypothetical protein